MVTVPARTTRPVRVVAAALALAVPLVATAARSGPPALPPLHADAVTLDDTGVPVPVPVGGGPLAPGTSVLASVAATPAGAREVARQRAWLADVPLPETGDPHLQGATTRALLDLRVLTLDGPGGEDGAVLAGTSPLWRHVWPRDASFAAAAWTAVGRHDEARAVVVHLARLAPAGGPWQARYVPDGSGDVPDDRPPQPDGAGWVLWASWLWSTSAPPTAATREAHEVVWPAVVASADELSRNLSPDGLPPSGPDYWERRERRVTLGVAVPTLVGLRAAADLAQRRGDAERARRWGDAARAAAAGMERQFAPSGWTRSARPRQHDAAAALLAPPFLPRAEAVPEAVAAAWRATLLANGGVSPGVGWHDDGVAWTPETALFALAWAGLGDDERARDVLAWLADHRTDAGSLPEKVLPDGRPASVAPLAWTAALVLLCAAALEEPLPVPPVPSA